MTWSWWTLILGLLCIGLLTLRRILVIRGIINPGDQPDATDAPSPHLMLQEDLASLSVEDTRRQLDLALQAENYLRAEGYIHHLHSLLGEAVTVDDLMLRADISLKLQRLDEGIQHLERVIDLDPMSVHAHFLLGETFGERGRYLEAKLAYERALTLVPEYLEAMMGLAKALRQLKLHHEAQMMQQAILQLEADRKMRGDSV